MHNTRDDSTTGQYSSPQRIEVLCDDSPVYARVGGETLYHVLLPETSRIETISVLFDGCEVLRITGGNIELNGLNEVLDCTVGDIQS